jgi:imidazolonepropionase-like amidohydrolase
MKWWSGNMEEARSQPELRYVSPAMRNWFNFRPAATVSPEQRLVLMKAIVKGMHDRGARQMLGTDCGFRYVIPGFAIHDEMRYAAEAGLKPYDIYRLCTVAAARFLGREQEFGTVEAGKRADLVLLAANPLEDVGNCRKRAGVMVNGHWLSAEYIEDRLKGIARGYAGWG